ncbi:ras-interacting protein RIP3-like [Teleopsis dalmanni]|uniref:ras-interacting protein RIP3-like n=1 Tax=Teleopsis dalmanni TaxID=139649 RepID=UPI0018CF02D7|nr:ras-interacting protein RIP3-like [Teleopsis dalmanni]
MFYFFHHYELPVILQQAQVLIVTRNNQNNIGGNLLQGDQGQERTIILNRLLRRQFALLQQRDQPERGISFVRRLQATLRRMFIVFGWMAPQRINWGILRIDPANLGNVATVRVVVANSVGNIIGTANLQNPANIGNVGGGTGGSGGNNVNAARSSAPATSTSTNNSSTTTATTRANTETMLTTNSATIVNADFVSVTAAATSPPTTTTTASPKQTATNFTATTSSDVETNHGDERQNTASANNSAKISENVQNNQMGNVIPEEQKEQQLQQQKSLSQQQVQIHGTLYLTNEDKSGGANSKGEEGDANSTTTAVKPASAETVKTPNKNDEYNQNIWQLETKSYTKDQPRQEQKQEQKQQQQQTGEHCQMQVASGVKKECLEGFPKSDADTLKAACQILKNDHEKIERTQATQKLNQPTLISLADTPAATRQQLANIQTSTTIAAETEASRKLSAGTGQNENFVMIDDGNTNDYKAKDSTNSATTPSIAVTPTTSATTTTTTEAATETAAAGAATSNSTTNSSQNNDNNKLLTNFHSST